MTIKYNDYSQLAILCMKLVFGIIWVSYASYLLTYFTLISVSFEVQCLKAILNIKPTNLYTIYTYMSPKKVNIKFSRDTVSVFNL